MTLAIRMMTRPREEVLLIHQQDPGSIQDPGSCIDPGSMRRPREEVLLNHRQDPGSIIDTSFSEMDGIRQHA